MNKTLNNSFFLINKNRDEKYWYCTAHYQDKNTNVKMIKTLGKTPTEALATAVKSIKKIK